MNFLTGKIKQRLIIQIAGFTALAMLILGVVVFVLLQQSLKQQSQQHLSQRAEGIMSLLEQRLAYLQENTERLTTNPFVIDSLINPESRQRDLPKLVENFAKGRDVKSFGLVDFDGKALFELGLKLPKYNDMPEMRAALAVAKLSMFITQQGDLAFVSPIEYYQTTQGAVVVTFDLNAIALRNAPPQTQGFLSLKNETGVLINIGKYSDKDFFHVELTADNKHQRLNALSMTLEIGELSSITESAIWNVVNKVLSISLLIMGIAVVIAVLIANSLARPIVILSERVKKSIEGSTTKCSPLGTDDELEDLANAFDRRTEALEDSHNHLEDLVSERTKELEETAKDLNNAQHIAKLGSFNWNITTGLLTWTDEHFRLMGLEPSSVAPSYEVFIQGVHVEDKDRVVEAINEAIDKTGKYACEHRVVWPDGTVKYLNGAGEITYDSSGSPLAMIGTILDVTDKVEIENALKMATENAQNANKAKSEFLANMSHEIRTPMNAVIGMTRLALKTSLDQQQKNYIEKANLSAENLLGIINDILDFSKIEAGKLELEESNFKITDVIDSVVHIIKLKAEEKGQQLAVKIAPDVPQYLKGDSLRIGQILINLASNAVKFTPEGGMITIEAELKESSDDNVLLYFRVIDTGIGLSVENQQKLFSSFSQADASTTRQYGGTGLGLAISSQLVKMMSGEIWLDSQEEVGATFHFTVKLLKALEDSIEKNIEAIGSSEHLEEIVASLRGTTVLLVEDNEINQELAKELLMDAGIIVDVASNGQEALDLLEQRQFDGVLMDCQMPVMDGYEATRKIREQDKLQNLPIIALTANAMKGDKEKVLAVGMNDHIAKPVDPDLMFITMARWIKSA